MTAFYPTKPICIKEYYQLNRKNWYVEINGKKTLNRPWQEFYCVLHKFKHKKSTSS